MTRLGEFDMAEWWDVARRLRPDMTWEQFEQVGFGCGLCLWGISLMVNT